MRSIDTVQDIFRALGGLEYIATRLGKSRSAVGMWVTYGHVAGSRSCVRVLISLEAQGHKLKDINPDLFNVPSWDAALIARVRRPRKRANGLRQAA